MRHADSCVSSICERGKNMDYYGASDQGLKRELNEDSYCCMENANGDFLACVCDGIGGAAAGEVASKMAIMHLQERFLSAPAFESEVMIATWLRQSIEEANDLIFTAAMRSVKQRGMGTTCVGVLRSNERTFVFNVGDSRVYALYADSFLAMTEDHSYIADLLKKGSITLEQAKVHPGRNMLTNALGVWDHVKIDIHKIREDYTALLVCSDGLHGYVSEETIRSVIDRFDCSAKQKAELLIQLANDMGGYDNVTVILMEKKAGEAHG